VEEGSVKCWRKKDAGAFKELLYPGASQQNIVIDFFLLCCTLISLEINE